MGNQALGFPPPTLLERKALISARSRRAVLELEQDSGLLTVFFWFLPSISLGNWPFLWDLLRARALRNSPGQLHPPRRESASQDWGGQLEAGQEGGAWEGKGHGPKFLGSCSFNVQKQNQRESDLETHTQELKKMGETNPEKGWEEWNSFAHSYSDVIYPSCLSRTLSLCPSLLSKPTTGHPCSPTSLKHIPQVFSGPEDKVGRSFPGMQGNPDPSCMHCPVKVAGCMYIILGRLVQVLAPCL